MLTVNVRTLIFQFRKSHRQHVRKGCQYLVGRFSLPFFSSSGSVLVFCLFLHAFSQLLVALLILFQCRELSRLWRITEFFTALSMILRENKPLLLSQPLCTKKEEKKAEPHITLLRIHTRRKPLTKKAVVNGLLNTSALFFSSSCLLTSSDEARDDGNQKGRYTCREFS